MNSPTAQNTLVLGVDIGGTKIAAAVMTVAGEVTHALTEPTLQEGPQAGIQQIIRMLDTFNSTIGALDRTIYWNWGRHSGGARKRYRPYHLGA